MTRQPTLVVCMGVSGSGKTTLGKGLAHRFDMTFVDADDYHSDANIQRMRGGLPLSDEDRGPWMELVCATLNDLKQMGRDCVLAHSALRRTHREQVRRVGFRTVFLHLRGDQSTIAHRIDSRGNHYMPVALLDSQFDALEKPVNELDVIDVDVANEVPEVLERAADFIDGFLTEETTHE